VLQAGNDGPRVALQRAQYRHDEIRPLGIASAAVLRPPWSGEPVSVTAAEWSAISQHAAARGVGSTGCANVGARS
jgi:hypothetical protein